MGLEISGRGYAKTNFGANNLKYSYCCFSCFKKWLKLEKVTKAIYWSIYVNNYATINQICWWSHICVQNHVVGKKIRIQRSSSSSSWSLSLSSSSSYQQVDLRHSCYWLNYIQQKDRSDHFHFFVKIWKVERVLVRIWMII